jgi:penicillin-insensitive murein DD-endopeptidase
MRYSAKMSLLCIALVFGPIYATESRSQKIESTGSTPSAPSTSSTATEMAPAIDSNADARKLFGAAKFPSAQPTKSIMSSPSCGCIAGAVGLPINGPYWQVMHLERNRRWGHPTLISYIQSFAKRAHEHGWNGLLIGDMSQPRGGPMTSGHASHQAGIDADIWIDPMPDHTLSDEERNKQISPSSVLKPGTNQLNPAVWNAQRAQFVRDAAMDPAVARIFVAPAIKQALAQSKDPAGKDTEWLRRLRPWWGHDDHIHVRLHCPQGEGCTEQEPQAEDDGCGAELDEWLAKTASPTKDDDVSPAFPLSKLPKECLDVLKAQDKTSE